MFFKYLISFPFYTEKISLSIFPAYKSYFTINSFTKNI